MLHRLNRLALYGLLILYVPLVIAAAVGLVYAGWWLTFCGTGLLREAGYSWRVRSPVWMALICFDLAAVFVAFLLLKGLVPLLFPQPDEPSGSRPLQPDEHPGLFTLILQICARLGVHGPDECYLSPFDDAFIVDRRIERPDGRLRRVRTLVIGAALVVHLRVDELATVLCHEMAHAATGDTAWARLAGRFHRSMVYAMEVQLARKDHPVANTCAYLILLGYYDLFERLYGIDARYRELLADRAAARICGPQNVRNALIRTHLVGELPGLSIRRLLAEYTRYQDSEKVANIYGEHRRRWLSLPGEARQRAENAIFLETGSRDSSHSCLADRMRNLAKVDAAEWKAEQPAVKLFHHWPALELEMTQSLMAWATAVQQTWIEHLDQQARVR